MSRYQVVGLGLKRQVIDTDNGRVLGRISHDGGSFVATSFAPYAHAPERFSTQDKAASAIVESWRAAA